MGTNIDDVSTPYSTDAYLDQAESVFLRPGNRYSWEEIVSGAPVQRAPGSIRRMCAVASNTFRGFHRVNKLLPGAKQAFIGYFVDERTRLRAELSAVRDRDEWHQLSNRICGAVRQRLDNISPPQLQSYNKVRKSVDLYVEHLVAMASELDDVRQSLIPLLFLPLDSQILAHLALFTGRELAEHGLSRTSTYKDIATEQTYLALQELVTQKAEVVAAERHRRFYPIYFDLLWSDRYLNSGRNLFETNP